MRTGKLLKEKVYLTHKYWDDEGRTHRTNYTAPAGTKVEWDEEKWDAADRLGTNAGSEEFYGGRLLHWVDLVHPDGGLYGGIGAEAGVDFEWDD